MILVWSGDFVTLVELVLQTDIWCTVYEYGRVVRYLAAQLPAEWAWCGAHCTGPQVPCPLRHRCTLALVAGHWVPGRKYRAARGLARDSRRTLIHKVWRRRDFPAALDTDQLVPRGHYSLLYSRSLLRATADCFLPPTHSHSWDASGSIHHHVNSFLNVSYMFYFGYMTLLYINFICNSENEITK